jgi:hypothetical protein
MCLSAAAPLASASGTLARGGVSAARRGAETWISRLSGKIEIRPHFLTLHTKAFNWVSQAWTVFSAAPTMIGGYAFSFIMIITRRHRRFAFSHMYETFTTVTSSLA